MCDKVVIIGIFWSPYRVFENEPANFTTMDLQFLKKHFSKELETF